MDRELVKRAAARVASRRIKQAHVVKQANLAKKLLALMAAGGAGAAGLGAYNAYSDQKGPGDTVISMRNAHGFRDPFTRVP